MDREWIKEFLEEKYLKYNCIDFIPTDPVQIPHQFTEQYDIEISAFLTATISWGQRKTIINSAQRLMQFMGNQPYEFVMNAGSDELELLRQFKHRTFNGTDFSYFIYSLKNIYTHYGGLGELFEKSFHSAGNIKEVLISFRKIFTGLSIPSRTQKHISDVEKNASAKRLNLFIRWMVRKDRHGVDFGIWQNIPASALFIPLDLHAGNVARALGLLKREQNDWKAVEELTYELRKFDPMDPVKYDYALFGLGIFEHFNKL